MKGLKSSKNTILSVAIFAMAMAFLESAVVVYLRAIYYPEGFVFPMKMLDELIFKTEFFRELATIVMLLCIAVIAGKSSHQRFAYFIFSFAVWDIFYYVFLYFLLAWPQSFMTWDVLFFIPTVWVGPVIAPVINSLCMIVLALMILIKAEQGVYLKGKLLWFLLIAGSIIVIISYTYDYSAFMLGHFSITELFQNTHKVRVMKFAETYVPQYFPWWIFVLGVIMHISAILMLGFRKEISSKI
jgi:hypothetical protein